MSQKRIQAESDLCLQLYKIIRVKNYLYPFPPKKEFKLKVYYIPQFNRKQTTYSDKQNVKKKAYVPRHDGKLLKMRPRVVLKKLNIVKISLYKK